MGDVRAPVVLKAAPIQTRGGRRIIAVLFHFSATISQVRRSDHACHIGSFRAGFLSAVSLTGVGQIPSNEKEQIAQHERPAQQYLREQRPDLAIPELKKIAALDPGNVEAHANLGVLLFFRGDYADAVPQLQTAINVQPNLWKVRSLLGLAEEHIADLSDARKDLEASFPMIEEKKLKIRPDENLEGKPHSKK